MWGMIKARHEEHPMKKIISAQLAGNIMLAILSLLTLFHVLVLLNVAPSDIVWAGQAGDSSGDMILMELFALFVTLLFMVIIAVRIGYFWKTPPRIITRIGMWVIFAFFVLNTVGNLASAVTVENLVFAPMTIILAILALRLAVKNAEKR